MQSNGISRHQLPIMPPKKSRAIPNNPEPPANESPSSSEDEDEQAITVRLTPEQKIFLESYFDDYEAATTKLDRRAISVKAATELLTHFNITDKGKSKVIRKVCAHTIYPTTLNRIDMLFRSFIHFCMNVLGAMAQTFVWSGMAS